MILREMKAIISITMTKGRLRLFLLLSWNLFFSSSQQIRRISQEKGNSIKGSIASKPTMKFVKKVNHFRHKKLKDETLDD